MNLLQRVKWALFPPQPKPRTQTRRSSGKVAYWAGSVGLQGLSTIGQGANHYYEALRTNGDRTNVTIQSFGNTPQYGACENDRLYLSMLSRALYENGGYVGYAVNQIANYSAPVCPQAASENAEWNTKAEDWFERWCKRADFYNRAEIDFDGLQTLMSQACDLDGDIGITVTDESGIPQVQLIDGWRITNPDKADEYTESGVKLDSKGRVQGYFVRSDGKHEFLSTNEMLLVRDPCLTSPYRGVSPMRRGMNDWRDAKDILGFEKLAVKHNASVIGVIKGGFLDESGGFDLTAQPGNDAQSGITQEEGEPLADATPGEKQLSRQDLLGGDIPVLEDGKEFQRVESNRPNAQFDDFLSSLISQFAAGLDIPPAYFLDSKLTGPNQRAVLGKAQKKFNTRQDTICRVVEWVWIRVIGWAIAKGELEAVDDWDKVQFQRPAKLSIDAGREAMQDREDAASGLMTRQDHYGARGKDWQRETDQSFSEAEYILGKASELAAKTGVAVEIILSRFGYDTKPPAPPPDPNQQPPPA